MKIAETKSNSIRMKKTLRVKLKQERIDQNQRRVSCPLCKQNMNENAE